MLALKKTQCRLEKIVLENTIMKEPNEPVVGRSSCQDYNRYINAKQDREERSAEKSWRVKMSLSHTYSTSLCCHCQGHYFIVSFSHNARPLKNSRQVHGYDGLLDKYAAKKAGLKSYGF